MDPFSPVAQSQLAEFDILRDQMENPSNGSDTKNPIGKFNKSSLLEPSFHERSGPNISHIFLFPKSNRNNIS